ncbi:hypothetical protein METBISCDRAFT_21060 [Metschnikowia bicuspidata]|uniref:Zinc finger PHD-type domain-containing protein n=1 Tax=Metschnikowia bicuspidata TaxID=27322 RepID=A0A4P9ZIF4_9ASCO|nr:hypothetical protein METBISCDRAFT_21060 [Metschnikowia bicuspidata]
MSEKNEDQQLLADASTLLMFASAAARQISPAPELVPEAFLHVSADVKSFRTQRPVLLINPRSGGNSPHSAGSATSAILHLAGSTFIGLSLLSADAPPPPQPLLPSIHLDASAPPLQRLGLQQYHDQSASHGDPYRASHPLSLNVYASHSYDSKHNLMHHSAQLPYPYALQQSNMVPANYKMMQSGHHDALFRTRYRTLSPKANASPDHPAQKLNLSPRFSNAQIQGTFHSMHKRASSDGSHQYKGGSNASNTVLNVALARGINVETGKRNIDNAKAAAAALAAAAVIPLPLRSNLDARKSESLPSDSKDIKREDVATEPEIDDNKTDIEPEPETGDQVKAEPAAESGGIDQSKPLADTPSFTCPSLESYRVESDAGIIGCICEINEDDGFTIQCDICFRWQHCSCMGFRTSDEVPEDEYKCYFCDKNKWNNFDAAACRKETLQRLESESGNEPELPAPKRKSLSGSSGDSKKRRKSEKVKPQLERVTGEKRPSSALSSAALPINTSIMTFEINNKGNPLLEDGVSAETYQGLYYILLENDYKTKDVKRHLQELGQSITQSNTDAGFIDVMSSKQFDLIKLCHVILPNYQKYLQDKGERRREKSFNKYCVKVKLYSDNPKQKFVGISKEGLYITDSSASADTETSIQAGTPVLEYLGEVDYLELYMKNKVNHYSVWGTVKPKVLRVDLKQNSDTNLSLVVDSRYVGNESRFIRKSCVRTANCEIKPVYISDMNVFKFLIVTTRPIKLKGEDMDDELRLPWEWDDLHPIKRMWQPDVDGDFKEGMKFDDFDEDERNVLVSGVNTMLNFVECGCNTSPLNAQCSIFKVKKATSYLLRSTRKASSLCSASSNKSKEDLVLPSKRRLFFSWQERLVEREKTLLAQYFNAKECVESFPLNTASSDSASEATAETTDNGDEKIKELKIPPRKQILLLSKRAAFNGYEFVPEKELKFDITTDTTVTPDMEKPIVPLTQEALLKIKEQVSQVLKPITDTVKPGKRAGAESPIVKQEILVSPQFPKAAVPLEAKVVPRELSSSSSNVGVKEPTEQKPLVVKKLSFADYKKKMK